ncbi:aldehyde dehydrogenase (NADP(+)) [Dinghuibacter silviterrae]|uniref:NADP-dependent aldehyde dehydrogenase n=1 Tax=Dinghuibacter silviterrae TaxID=1539049 RepID=A0A4R8DUW6_9BACT|nr:aldehyde dehydrogenase (NADP(+)) [Dinghuibacter silviterrae]TDX01255.1 NADP-dependent aldehyde dehydrogenase [Dinghuibacter silviterrae]
MTTTLQLAHEAFPIYSQLSPSKRAGFLDAISEEIMAIGDQLIETCCAESGLPAARITGERARTCGQLQLFARLLREGSWVDARIDALPAPRPVIRRMLIPLGPVAVFGASNFPLAFSTAGGDTASALAAGCPVVVKAHSSHLRTHALVAAAIDKAATRTGMPKGVFGGLQLSHEEAVALVENPIIQAVGFTGSRRVGMLLYRAATQRPQPIPVFAEMSSINPVVLLESALTQKTAQGLAASVTLGVGQFCTNPGLVLFIDSAAASAFVNAFGEAMSNALPGRMLNAGIQKAYDSGVEALQKASGVTEIARSSKEGEGRPFAFSVSADLFLADAHLSDEVFGPATLLVRCKDEAQLLEVLQSLEGQLTATVHGEGPLLARVTDVLVQKAGRVIYGGYPTGVEVCDSMQHGGPFPSTTDPRFTSVGTAAILRFVRPVAYQDFPAELLPEALQDGNPLGIMRTVNGKLTREAVQ